MSFYIDYLLRDEFQSLLTRLANEGEEQEQDRLRQVSIFRNPYRGGDVFGPRRTIQEIQLLFRAVTALSNLSALILHGFATAELGDVARYFEMPCLVQVALKMAPGEAVADSFLNALATSCPSLRIVSFNFDANLPFSFSTISRSQSIKSLDFQIDTFQRYPGERPPPALMDTNQILRLCQGLEINSTLRALDLEQGVCDQGLQLVAENLIRVNTTLRTLNLSFETKSEQVLLALSEALRENSTLVHFQNHKWHDCESSTTNSADVVVQESFLTMLEQNYSLHVLDLFNEEQCTDFRRRKEMYLKLNSYGRGRLFQQAGCNDSSEHWITMIESVRDDLDCLFYLLTRNPSLCQGQLLLPPLQNITEACDASCDWEDENKEENTRKRRRRSIEN
jgi:hypothetical protein